MSGKCLLLCVAAALVSASIPSTARAIGGNYTISGGNAFERSQVRQALAASSFNWSVVPGPVTITITPEPASQAVPGKILLDPALLDMGQFSWGVVQHEYAHQVDFALLDDESRSEIQSALGGSVWCYDGAPVLPHSQYACERFASTLAWAFWPSPSNSMSPATIGGGESSGMAPAVFRALVTSILGASSVQAVMPSASDVPRYAPVLLPALRHNRVACDGYHRRSA